MRVQTLRQGGICVSLGLWWHDQLPNVPLLDEDTGVVDALGKTTGEHESLETTLEEILNLKGENVIETLHRKATVRNRPQLL